MATANKTWLTFTGDHDRYHHMKLCVFHNSKTVRFWGWHVGQIIHRNIN